MSEDSATIWLMGRYRLHGTLVEFDYRRVWRAYDRLLRRNVVIKGAFSEQGGTRELAVVEEYRCLRRCRHPRIARAYDIGVTLHSQTNSEPGRFVFFTQAFLTGSSILSLRGQSPDKLLRHVKELLEIVAYLHHQHLVRLDLKPPHLLVGRNGLRLLDLDQARTEDPLALGRPAGTLAYVAPEILNGDTGSPQSDLYSVGAILFEILTGSPPPVDGETLEAVYAHLKNSPVPVFSDEVRAGFPLLASLAENMLQRNPAERPESASAVLERLNEGTSRPWRAGAPLPICPLIGRDTARAMVETLETRAAGERGGLVALTGSNGSGHSRFLAELCTAWHARGWPSLRLPCHLLPGTSFGGIDLVCHHLSMLCGEKYSPVEVSTAGAPDIPTEEAVERTITLAVQHIRERGVKAARASGDVLIPILLDDPLHLDPLSLQTLCHLVPVLPDSGILLVLGGEGVEDILAAQPGGTDLLGNGGKGGLGGLSGSVQVPLEPLSEQDVRAIAEKSLGGQGGFLTAEETRALCLATGGLPGRLVDALEKRWHDPLFDLTRWSPEDAATTAYGILESLPDEQARTLRTAAIFDRPFNPRVLAALLEDDGISPDTLALVELGLLVPLARDPEEEPRRNIGPESLMSYGRESFERFGEDPHRSAVRDAGAGFSGEPQGSSVREPLLSFVREPLRRAVEEAVPPPEREALHLRLAEVLEQQYLLERKTSPGEVAHHFLQGGAQARARPYLHLRVDEALKALNLYGAARALSRLLQLGGPDNQKVELLRRLGDIQLDLGRHAEAKQTFESALVGPVMSPPRRARCLAGLAWAVYHLEDRVKASELLQEALLIAAESPGVSDSDRVLWLQRSAWLTLESKDLPKATASLKQARAIGLPPESRVAVEQAYLEAFLGVRTGQAPAGLEARLIEALEMAERIGYERGRMKIHNTLADLYRRTANHENLTRHLEAVLALAKSGFDIPIEATASHNLGVVLVSQGKDSAGLPFFERAAELYHRLGNVAREIYERLTVIHLLLQHRQLERSAIALRHVGTLLSTQGDAPQLTISRLSFQLLEAQLQRLQGKLEGLDNRLSAIQDTFAGASRTDMVLETVSERMALELACGRPGAALDCFAGVASLVADATTPDVRRRLHALAIEAHLALDPGAPLALGPETRRQLVGELSPGNSIRSADRQESSTLGPEGRTAEPMSAQPGSGPGRAAWTVGAGRETTAQGAGPEASGAESGQETRGMESGQKTRGMESGKAGRPAGRGPLGVSGVFHSDPADWRGGPENAPRILIEPVQWVHRINRILEIADEEEALAAELAALVGEVLSGRGLVILWEGGRPHVARSHRLDEEQVNDISYSVVERVRRSKVPYVCPDVRVDQDLSGMRSIRAADVASLICYPVVRNQVCLGVIYVDHRAVGAVSSSPTVQVIEQVAELTGNLLEAIQRRRRHEAMGPEATELIGESSPMRALKARVVELAEARDPELVVLLLGETGTGKSRVAREIWRTGSRRQKQFYPVNCAAVERNLFAAQMFGHVRGAFTSAHQSQSGWLELSEGGVLFLDEIGEIPLQEQASLLSVLQERTFNRVGNPGKSLRFDAQLLCATNRDLLRMFEEGRFRDDLLRRIHVNVCTLPPLRECGKDDIRLLSCAAVRRYLEAQGILAQGDTPLSLEQFLTRSAQHVLYTYEWPWNIGELENFYRNEVVRRHLRTLGKEKIDAWLVEEVLGRGHPGGGVRAPAQRSRDAAQPGIPAGLTIKGLGEWWNQAKAVYVRRLHDSCGSNFSETARRLQCSRDMVYKYVRDSEKIEE